MRSESGWKPGTGQVINMGMMASIMSVLSVIPLPFSFLGVPMTLQTFAAALVGYMLGAFPGGMTALLYLLIGLVGIPVYNGGQAGPGVLFGLAGGFIFGFIPMAFICGTGNKVNTGKKWMDSLAACITGTVGLLICHLIGVVQFSLVYNSMNSDTAGFVPMSIGKSFLMVSLPYLPKDILSVVLAYAAANTMKRALKKAGLM